VRAWLRLQDRLIACELEPRAVAALGRNLRGDERIKTIAIDGWTALSAFVPPKERRGPVLVDPPFEADSDFRRLAQGPDVLAKRLRRLRSRQDAAGQADGGAA
jgi:23S rRNA (adenine2030-N6)-methyltransferase